MRRSLKRKTPSTISCSAASNTPAAVPSTSIIRISSSEISGPVDSLIPKKRNPNSVDHPRKALIGEASFERNKIGRATDFAMPSGLFIPNRLGNNSPITSDK